MVEEKQMKFEEERKKREELFKEGKQVSCVWCVYFYYHYNVLVVFGYIAKGGFELKKGRMIFQFSRYFLNIDK